MRKAKIEFFVGQKFGRLMVIEILPNSMLLCECVCGKIKSIYRYSLAGGYTVSCGCWNEEKMPYLSLKHGLSNSRIYVIRNNMISRCYNKKSKSYPSYGKRGIRVCDEWKNSFESFYAWAMANGYAENLTIDRIDNDGNYEPQNCKWITRAENLKKKGKPSNNKTGYKGVYWSERDKLYSVQIRVNKKISYFGCFRDPIEAAKAYDKAAIKYIGKFAWLNFPKRCSSQER